MPSIVRRNCLYTSGLPAQGQGREDSLAALSWVPLVSQHSVGTGKLTLGGAYSAVKIRTAIMTGDINRQMPPFSAVISQFFPCLSLPSDNGFMACATMPSSPLILLKMTFNFESLKNYSSQTFFFLHVSILYSNS